MTHKPCHHEENVRITDCVFCARWAVDAGYRALWTRIKDRTLPAGVRITEAAKNQIIENVRIAKPPCKWESVSILSYCNNVVGCGQKEARHVHACLLESAEWDNCIRGDIDTKLRLPLDVILEKEDGTTIRSCLHCPKHEYPNRKTGRP